MKYSAYYLTIESELPLPLPESISPDKPDIKIIKGDLLQPETLYRSYDGVWYAHEEGSLFLKWDALGSFRISQGREIVVAERKMNGKHSPVAALLGTVMAVAIQQRGTPTLHGSGMLIDDAAIIFLGQKGEGKSTIAGFLQKQGNAIISDDVCAIDMQDKEKPIISPSFSNLKLWPDAMHYLDYQIEQFERVHPALEKRNICLNTGFSYSRSPVAAMIVLTTGPEISLTPLTGHQGLPFLLAHLIINRFPEHQPDKLVRSIYNQMTDLLQHVPLYRLTRPRDISLLPRIQDLIRDMIRNQVNASNPKTGIDGK